MSKIDKVQIFFGPSPPLDAVPIFENEALLDSFESIINRACTPDFQTCFDQKAATIFSQDELVCTGWRGYVDGWKRWLKAWQSWEVEPLEFYEADEERVLAICRNTGYAKTGGVGLDMLGATIFTFTDDGLICRLQFFFEAEDAVADLGFDPRTADVSGEPPAPPRQQAQG